MLSSRKRLWLWLDPTINCNLSCNYCYTKESHGKTDMDPDDFRAMLKDLVSNPNLDLQSTHLNWRGEPLMNKRFSKLVEIYSELASHVPMQYHTNGILLTRRRVEQLSRINLDHLIFVSIDGGTEAAHDYNRGTGNFRKSIKGLKNLLDHNERKRFARIGVYLIDMGVKREQYDPEFAALLERVDRFTVVPPVLDEDMTQKQSQFEKSNEIRVSTVIPQRERVQPQNSCFWAGNSMFVAPTGDVSICILSHKSDGIVGNLLKEPSEVVLQRAVAMREGIDEVGRRNILHCESCYKEEGDAFS